MLLSKRTKKKLELNFVLTIYFTKFKKKKKTILGCKYIKLKVGSSFQTVALHSTPILNNKFAS